MSEFRLVWDKGTSDFSLRIWLNTTATNPHSNNSPEIEY